MRKRDRSASASPALRAAPPVEQPSERLRLRQQVLLDVLRRTSLAEQKDREIVEWLTDAAEWLQDGEFEKLGAGALAELRFVVLGVLHTMPWWRVVEAVDPKRATVASRSARCATRAITRWHEKIQVAFERVCILLVEQSPHAVRGVLEVAMRPFQMRPPVADGARRLLPADSIMRLMNTVAAKYPGGVVLDVLEQCMRSLVPKRRWAEQRHHMACIALFLHLALEAHIPLYPAHDWGEDHLLGNNNNDVADTSKGAVGNASFRGSEDSGTDAGASSASHRKDCLRPLEMTAPMMSASDADFSDASISLASPTGVHPFATRFTEFTTQNNRMLAYRNELIRFVLQQLLNMELSLQSSDGAPLQDLASSSTSLGCCGNTTDSIRVLAGPSFGRVKEQSLEKPFVEILRNSTSLVFHRLAEDLMRQQTAGVCGNAEWWRELLAFHLTSVLKMECPICLLYLAPSLALLGGEEEAIDMMHKLVSVVTKGYQPVQQNTWRAAAAGPARVRMAPPSVGPLMIPMAHRVRAAAYLYPLFHFLRERLGNGEGTRKRLLKWVVQELRNTTLSSSHSLSSPSLLVQVLFAQCAAMSQLLGADFIEEIKSHAPDSKLLKSLMDKYLLPQGVERRMADEGGEGPPSAGDPVSCSQQLDLAQMEADGLLHTQLMGSCPWDWRRCQGGRDADR